MKGVTKIHVVVVGAGFGGLAVARDLAAKGCPVTLIDRHPYTTFQPLLYQVATGGLNPGDVTYSLRSLAARYKEYLRYRRASVERIDEENQQVICDAGDPVPYDYLVLAQGVGANFFGIPGADTYARSIYTRAEALGVRDIIFSGLEALTIAPKDRKMSIIVVGGGATGVEMAGALAEMKSMGIPSAYPELDPGRLQISLVEAGPSLLAPFRPRLQKYAMQELRSHGVDVRVHSAIAQVRADAVELNDRTVLAADLVIWAAGIGGHSLVKEWGMPLGKGGRILMDDHCRVQGKENIFAIGDAAINPDNPSPQLAQPALQMGKHVAREIQGAVDGEPVAQFAYHDKGTMATISRNAAVVQLKRIDITGLFAWVFWVLLHITFLLGGRNRLAAMLNLGARYIVYPRNATAIVGDVAESPGGHVKMLNRIIHHGEVD